MLLAIDLGQKKTGLAISHGSIASPYKTIIHKSQKELVENLAKICKREGVDKIILGVVEGKTKAFFNNFKSKISKDIPDIKVIFVDETLSTRQARETMIKLNIPKMKRKGKEHEVAAAIILQNYLDAND